MRLFLISLLLLLTGCQSNPYGEVPKELALTVRSFESVVRWGALQKMYVFQNNDPEEVVELQEGLNNVRVTSYELASELREVSEWRWVQTAVIDYVLIDQQVVRQLIDQQVWVSDDAGKTWYRENPVPQFQ
jgi:hypothetical protein